MHDDPEKIVDQARETYKRIYYTNNRLMHRVCMYIPGLVRLKSLHQRKFLEFFFSKWNEGMRPEAGADARTEAGTEAGTDAGADAGAYAGPYA